MILCIETHQNILREGGGGEDFFYQLIRIEEIKLFLYLRFQVTVAVGEGVAVLYSP